MDGNLSHRQSLVPRFLETVLTTAHSRNSWLGAAVARADATAVGVASPSAGSSEPLFLIARGGGGGGGALLEALTAWLGVPIRHRLNDPLLDNIAILLIHFGAFLHRDADGHRHIPGVFEIEREN
jgi:hypothetical protein